MYTCISLGNFQEGCRCLCLSTDSFITKKKKCRYDMQLFPTIPIGFRAIREIDAAIKAVTEDGGRSGFTTSWVGVLFRCSPEKPHLRFGNTALEKFRNTTFPWTGWQSILQFVVLIRAKKLDFGR